MNKKPSWGLWLLVIIVPFAMFFVVSMKEKPKLRDSLTREEITFDNSAKAAAAQGIPHLSSLRLSPLPNNSGYLVRVSVFNPQSGVPEVHSEILSGAEEISQDNTQGLLKNGGGSILDCYGKPYCSTTVLTVKKIRQQAVRVRLKWTTANAAGRYVNGQKDIVITPQMK